MEDSECTFCTVEDTSVFSTTTFESFASLDGALEIIIPKKYRI